MNKDTSCTQVDRINPILELKNIKKFFGGVKALNSVDFSLYKSEIVGLIGDNGAGKSTLIKIVCGVLQPTEGEIYIEGKEVSSINPRTAREMGIETIFQDLALFDMLDISSNVFAGREVKKWLFFLNNNEMDRLSESALHKIGTKFGSNLRQPVGELSGGQKHAVAISRSVYVSGSPKIILMDEPTAGLGVKESNDLLGIIKELKKTGVSIIFITHSLDHAFKVSDRFVVLRSGLKVGERLVGETDDVELIKLMLGVV